MGGMTGRRKKITIKVENTYTLEYYKLNMDRAQKNRLDIFDVENIVT